MRDGRAPVSIRPAESPASPKRLGRAAGPAATVCGSAAIVAYKQRAAETSTGGIAAGGRCSRPRLSSILVSEKVYGRRVGWQAI